MHYHRLCHICTVLKWFIRVHIIKRGEQNATGPRTVTVKLDSHQYNPNIDVECLFSVTSLVIHYFVKK